MKLAAAAISLRARAGKDRESLRAFCRGGIYDGMLLRCVWETLGV